MGRLMASIMTADSIAILGTVLARSWRFTENTQSKRITAVAARPADDPGQGQDPIGNVQM